MLLSEKPFFRRRLLQTAMSTPAVSLASFVSGSQAQEKTGAIPFDKLVENLLAQWCDGMLAHQINMPADSKMHGALWCPACQKIHGRCMDAVYPFLHMAHKTGEQRYLQAAIDVMDWAEKNVSLPSGAWTVIPDPKSWPGITVFGLIALAEALHYHGDILPPKIQQAWRQRLQAATEFVFQEFDLAFTNINYGITALYALNFAGRELGIKKYVARSRTLAKGVTAYLTKPNYFIYGEFKPSHATSDKGLKGIDLGYNVEETINGLVMYAKLEGDEKLLDIAQVVMENQLQFMMPDGAWDNSWGTRQNKWSYWGSRTTDGCQLAHVAMAHRNPAFGTAAFKSTQLLQRCSSDALLHGGLHYKDHGVLPCIHHTFAHAKPLAALLDGGYDLKRMGRAPIPQASPQGLKHFAEIDVWQSGVGPWRLSVSSYDAIYKKYAVQVTGGSIGLLWHEQLGPVLSGSMAEYMLVEVNNQQPDPDGEDIALTPRLEASVKGVWYTNLFDLKAKVLAKAGSNNKNHLQVATALKDRDFQSYPLQQPRSYTLDYVLTKQGLDILIESQQDQQDDAVQFVLPVICRTSERVEQHTSRHWSLAKQGGLVHLKSDVDIKMRKTKRDRTFNMVPGFQAVVFDVPLTQKRVKISLTSNA